MDEQSVNHCQNSQGEQRPLTRETVSPGSERLSVTHLHQHLGKCVQYYLPVINLEEVDSSFKSLSVALASRHGGSPLSDGALETILL